MFSSNIWYPSINNFSTSLLSSSFRDESKDSLFAYADNRTRLFGLWLKDGLLGEPYKNISDIEKLNFRTN